MQASSLDTTNPRAGASAGQSFPPGGLVAKSRMVYQTTPLATDEIRPGIFTFRGAGGAVTAIAGSQRCAVIDTGYGPRVDEIRAAIAAALRQPPRWLINTHWHFDHTDGNGTFAESGATIVAHSRCRVRLSENQYVPSLEWSIPASPRIAWPALTFDSAISLDLGSQTLELLPQEPAHTDGDVAVWLPSANVLVMGDLFINGSYGVIDESSRGSLRGMINALERLLPLVNADTVVVPGHGAIGDRRTLVAFADVLRAIEERVQSLVASHSTAAEIIAAAPTREFDAVWGTGYVTGDIFIRMVLAGLGLETKTKGAGHSAD
jgi:cyclase